jgi:hypothetical protein
MSPTQFAVRRAKLDAELEVARRAGDVPQMRSSLAGLTALYTAMYGWART